MELKDKIVLITGSSQGIGKETALGFAKKGANVVVTYNTNKKGAEEIFNECNKIKNSFLINLNINDDESIKNCVEKVIDKFGAIDILVNNAGVITWKNLIEQNNEEIEFQINTNLTGLIKMTKACLPYFKGQDEGIIINISSGAGKTGFAGLSVYCGTKFGVRGFTQALAQELPKNIRIYSLNPGLTATQMTNFQGVNPGKVADLIVNTAEEKFGIESGGDVDVWKYL